MNREVWHKIFADWVKSYESINHLDKHCIAQDFEIEKLYMNLLNDIVQSCSEEIEDD